MHHKYKNLYKIWKHSVTNRYFIHHFNQDIVQSSQNVIGILLHLTHTYNCS